MFWITANRAIIGDKNRVIAPAWIGVEKKHIVSVRTERPKNAKEENIESFDDVTLTPGLVDTHDHVFRKPIPFSEELSHTDAGKLYYDRNSYSYIMCMTIEWAGKCLRDQGVTIIRDLGWSGTDHPFALRRALNSDLLEGPDLQVCGTYICRTGGHGYMLKQCIEADGIDEIKKATRKQIKDGADVIKIMGSGGLGVFPQEQPIHPEYSFEEIRTCVDVAHDAGLPVAMHVYPAEGILRAVKAGIDSIEHGCLMTDECIELMARNGTAFNPTMIGIRTPITRNSSMKKYLPEITKKFYEPQVSAMRKAKKAGIDIGIGPDTRGTMIEEIQMVSEALELTPVEAIEHATSISAKVIKRSDMGLLSEGKIANIIAYKGDLTKSLDCLENVVQVWKNGRKRR